MAKNIAFPLIMADKAHVRTIYELREHFDLATVLGCYYSGDLYKWLAVRHYGEEADKVKALDKSSEDFKKNLCEILGMPYSEIEANNLNTQNIKIRQRNLAWLQQLTTNDAVLEAADHVAISQNELADLLDEGVKEIYLCGYQFTIPGHRGGITYKGVNRPWPVVEFDGEIVESGIDLVNLEFDISIYIGDGSDNIKFYRFFDKNRELGVKLLRIAAEKESAVAQTVLGKCYIKGFGVKENPKEAVRWSLKAAEQGNAQAQEVLGHCYRYGIGVEKKPEEAVRWSLKAAEQGNAQAQTRLGICYEKGFGIEKNLEEAVRWYQRAAEQDYVTAQFYLGSCFKNSRGVERNFKEAAKWYRKAAEQGYADAQYELGMCYWRGDINGEGSESSKEAAIKWLKKAAEQGNKSAQDILK